ncbi:MAG: tyrosine-type recombinase/integrase, partial [Lysobacterales bacterium]
QDWHDARQPYPLNWDEQKRLLEELPEHLGVMALFGINTGLRNREICKLQWDDECEVPELGSSVFVLPAERNKNGQERLVVLNRIARSVVNHRRGIHPRFVFTYARSVKQEQKPLGDLTSPAWSRAIRRVGLPIRPHDLRHTFGRRLRSAGVSQETRKALLGHKNGDVTTHYSAPEIQELLDAVESICSQRKSSPTLTLIRRKTG